MQCQYPNHDRQSVAEPVVLVKGPKFATHVSWQHTFAFQSHRHQRPPAPSGRSPRALLSEPLSRGTNSPSRSAQLSFIPSLLPPPFSLPCPSISFLSSLTCTWLEQSRYSQFPTDCPHTPPAQTLFLILQYIVLFSGNAVQWTYSTIGTRLIKQPKTASKQKREREEKKRKGKKRRIKERT